MLKKRWEALACKNMDVTHLQSSRDVSREKENISNTCSIMVSGIEKTISNTIIFTTIKRNVRGYLISIPNSFYLVE